MSMLRHLLMMAESWLALRGPNALCARCCREWILLLCFLSCVVDLAFLDLRRRPQGSDLKNSILICAFMPYN